MAEFTNEKESRADYYSKWDKFTKDELEKTKEDEEKAKVESDKKLGISTAPRSEAHAKDLAKRAALKQAKAAWQEKQDQDLAARIEIKGHSNEELMLDSALLESKPVVIIKEGQSTKYHLSNKMQHRVIKLFMESCTDCHLIIDHDTITSHVEISHCDNLTVEVRAPTATLQADLCDGLTITYAENMLQQTNYKVYHAGVKNMTLDTKCGHSVSADYVKDLEGIKLKQGIIPEEQQFVTHFVEGKLVCEPVYRGKSNMPITQSEADNEMNADNVQTLLRSAELKKIGGNEAFKEGNYAQAAIFYTEAIDICEQAIACGEDIAEAEKGLAAISEDAPAEPESPPVPEVLPVSLSNRAACFLKLGHHEKALEDAERCIELRPKYTKGYFRKGLSLHALKRYYEAGAALSNALDFDPKNQSIKQALTFTEASLRKIARENM